MKSDKKPSKAKSKKLAEKKKDKKLETTEKEKIEKQEEEAMKCALESSAAEEEEKSSVEAAATEAEGVAKNDDKDKKQKKEISLRQYLLFAEDERDPSKSVAAFFLQTCPVKAREDFLKRWPSFKIYNVIQSAASDKTASWLKDHDSF